jgi:hypothetical protein
VKDSLRHMASQRLGRLSHKVKTCCSVRHIGVIRGHQNSTRTL